MLNDGCVLCIMIKHFILCAFSFSGHFCAVNINPVMVLHPSEGNISFQPRIIFALAQGTWLEIIILSLIKTGFLPHFWAVHSAPTDFITGKAGWTESRVKLGRWGLRSPCRESAASRKRRASHEEQKWLSGTGLVCAGSDQAAARARGKWRFLMERSFGSYGFGGRGQAVSVLTCRSFTLGVF